MLRTRWASHFCSALLSKLSARMYWFEVCLFPGSLQSGVTPLGHACSRGQVEVVRALLSAGANMESADKVGITLLLCTLSTLSSRMYWFEVCLFPGSAQNGFTPLGYACLQGHLEVVRALLSAGANKGAADKVGNILLLCYSCNIVCKHVLI